MAPAGNGYLPLTAAKEPTRHGTRKPWLGYRARNAVRAWATSVRQRVAETPNLGELVAIALGGSPGRLGGQATLYAISHTPWNT